MQLMQNSSWESHDVVPHLQPDRLGCSAALALWCCVESRCRSAPLRQIHIDLIDICTSNARGLSNASRSRAKFRDKATYYELIWKIQTSLVGLKADNLTFLYQLQQTQRWVAHVGLAGTVWFTFLNHSIVNKSSCIIFPSRGWVLYTGGIQTTHPVDHTQTWYRHDSYSLGCSCNGPLFTWLRMLVRVEAGSVLGDGWRLGAAYSQYFYRPFFGRRAPSWPQVCLSCWPWGSVWLRNSKSSLDLVDKLFLLLLLQIYTAFSRCVPSCGCA